MGIVFFILSFAFLFFVEGEVCKAFVMMNHAKKACQKEISADRVQRKYQNCMVHITGPMTTETGQRDEDLGFTPAEKCVVLKRTVESCSGKSVRGGKEVSSMKNSGAQLTLTAASLGTRRATKTFRVCMRIFPN